MKKIKQWIFKINLMYPNAFIVEAAVGGFVLCYMAGFLYYILFSDMWPFNLYTETWEKHVIILGVGIFITAVVMVMFAIIESVKRQFKKIKMAWKNPVPTMIPAEAEDFTAASLNSLSDCLNFICDHLIYMDQGFCDILVEESLPKLTIVESNQAVYNGFESSLWSKFFTLQLEKFDGMAVVLLQNRKIVIVSMGTCSDLTTYNLLAAKDINALCDDNSKAEREDMILKAEQEHERIKCCNNETGTTGR